MLLTYFSVENFKNFSNKFCMNFSDVKDYDFNTSCLKDDIIKDAIIYGKNAVGKTNFGFALFDITYHLVDKQKDPRISINYLNADSEKKEASFCYEFRDKENTFVYSYRKTDAVHLTYESLSVDGNLVFSFDFKDGNGDFSHLAEFGLNTLNWKYRDNGISLIRYMANNLSLSSDHPIMKIMNFVNGMLWFCSLGNGNAYVGFSSKLEQIPDFIIKEGYVAEFQDFLNKNGVNEHITKAINPDGSSSLYFKHKRLIPFSMASSGTNALMTFFYWYKHIKGISFLFIDEFDAFYHYELAENVVKLLRDKIPVQAILTSHNTSLMANRFMRPDCYFILTEDKIVSLPKATDRELRQGHNLEKLYMNGEFDA